LLSGAAFFLAKMEQNSRQKFGAFPALAGVFAGLFAALFAAAKAPANRRK